jgi:hypothetical protein
MKKLPLSQNKYALVDDADFEWLNQWKWSYVVLESDQEKAIRKEPNTREGKNIYLHRQIMEFPDGEVDHINRNGLDNQRANLRLATRSQNAANRGVQKDSASQLKGVYYDARRSHWIAYAKKDGKRYYGGSHKNKESAAKAYNRLAVQLHGSFAVLNVDGYALS